MRRPPEPPSFDDDSLADELLAAEPDLIDFEDDEGPFDSSRRYDEPDIPHEPVDFAGPNEPAEPARDRADLGDDEDAGADLATASDARRYAQNLTVVEDDDSDEAARFLTYRNYVGALALILREQYGAAPWLTLAKAVRDLPGVQRIQRRRLPDLDRKRAARELRGAWAYELSMSPPSELFAIDVPDLVMIANHTAGVHAHYAIYKMCRALALALGIPMPEEHERHLDVVEQQFLRRGLMPSPWDARCDKGGAPRSRKRGAHTFQAFPAGTTTCPNLWRASTDTMWSLLATALKTTRDRSRGFEDDAGASSCRMKERDSGVNSPTSPPRTIAARAGRNHQGRPRSGSCGCSSMTIFHQLQPCQQRRSMFGLSDAGSVAHATAGST